MASTRVFKPSFSGGELSPEMFAHIDDGKFQSGASSIENMIATALGPAEKRPGFEFVAPTKNNGVARLIPFTYSTTQTMVIEIGEGYFRFHTLGATLQYSPTQRDFISVGIPVTFSAANPTVVTWVAHGLVTGDLVQFMPNSAALPPEVRVGVPSEITDSDPSHIGYSYAVTVIDADTFHIVDPATGLQVAVAVAPSGTAFGVKVYAAGELCSFGGDIYYCSKQFVNNPSPPSDPSTEPTHFYVLPVSRTFEIQNSYAVDDLFAIHYVQSADVMTLTHPNYPPMELRRLGATTWSFIPIVFGQTLAAPTGVAVTASPGYQAQVASISTASPALFTTVASHTLNRGDGIYIKGLTVTIGGSPVVLDGFYLVSDVPIDGSGNLIPNQLYVMDYNGNLLDSTGWDSPYFFGATIQFGSKIFNINTSYAVTAIASNGVEQSSISVEVSVINNLDVSGSFNTITWLSVPGAFRYYIYKKLNGLYGYIGQTPAGTLSFDDNNIAADMSITPPIFDPVFGSADNYPGAVSYYQQRRCFGGTTNQPQNFWMTKSGTESDMSYSLPVQDTDRVAIGIAVREMSTIEHIVPLLQLILLTSSAEMSVSPLNTDVITPSTIDPRPQSYIGASNVQPTIVNNSLIYCAARGGHVREMGYQWQIGGYLTGDISLRAAHLFDNLTIVDQAFMKCPWQVVWFVSSNGTLLGLSYIPEQAIGAWHHHVTDGAFESIACVAEGAEDRLYAVVNRTVNGATVRYIERMRPRNYGFTKTDPALQNAFFVDAGATFDGTNTTGTTIGAVLDSTPGPLQGTYNLTASAAAFVFPTQSDAGSYALLTGSDGKQYQFKILSTSSTTVANALPVTAIPAGVTFAASEVWAWARTTIGGLTWLEGKTVSILADGAVQTQQVVTAGAVSVQNPSRLVTVGLPFSPAINTLPLVMQIDAMGQGRVKNINRCWVRVYQSSSIFAGPTSDSLIENKQRTNEPYGSPPNPVTKEVEIVIPADWSSDGQVYITQKDPLPLTVVGLTVEAAIGG
jgi:hypothetical protein